MHASFSCRPYKILDWLRSRNRKHTMQTKNAYTTPLRSTGHTHVLKLSHFQMLLHTLKQVKFYVTGILNRHILAHSRRVNMKNEFIGKNLSIDLNLKSNHEPLISSTKKNGMNDFNKTTNDVFIYMLFRLRSVRLTMMMILFDFLYNSFHVTTQIYIHRTCIIQNTDGI